MPMARNAGASSPITAADRPSAWPTRTTPASTTTAASSSSAVLSTSSVVVTRRATACSSSSGVPGATSVFTWRWSSSMLAPVASVAAMDISWAETSEAKRRDEPKVTKAAAPCQKPHKKKTTARFT